LTCGAASTARFAIEIDPERIKAVGLSLNDQVIEAIGDANLDLPAGKIEQGKYEVTLGLRLNSSTSTRFGKRSS
jgi:multidrug efflux pump subunit AcrB